MLHLSYPHGLLLSLLLQALTPLTIGRGRVAASALGAIWGFGHSTGQLILGLVFVLLKERFHDFVPFLSRWAGTVVGCTLLAIGGMGIYESWVEPAVEARGQGHASSSSSGGSMDGGDEAPAVGTLALEGGVAAPASSDAKDAGWLGLRWMRTVMRRGLGTYATGIVYGLQPDALFVVIPALALPTKLAAVAYCTMFVLGTVTAMGGYTLVIGTTSSALTRDKPWLQAHLSTIASGVAITVGLLVLAASFGVTIPGVPMLGGGG